MAMVIAKWHNDYGKRIYVSQYFETFTNLVYQFNVKYRGKFTPASVFYAPINNSFFKVWRSDKGTRIYRPLKHNSQNVKNHI